MRRRFTHNADDAEVNVTPLLDIVFIMLIFFIVTSTFIKEPGIDPDRPEAVTAGSIKQISLLVGIDAEDQIWIDKEVYQINEVRAKVEELRRETPKGTAVVMVDAGASSEALLDVLQQMKNAGEVNIHVATEE